MYLAPCCSVRENPCCPPNMAFSYLVVRTICQHLNEISHIFEENSNLVPSVPGGISALFPCRALLPSFCHLCSPLGHSPVLRKHGPNPKQCSSEPSGPFANQCCFLLHSLTPVPWLDPGRPPSEYLGSGSLPWLATSNLFPTKNNQP